MAKIAVTGPAGHDEILIAKLLTAIQRHNLRSRVDLGNLAKDYLYGPVRAHDFTNRFCDVHGR